MNELKNLCAAISVRFSEAINARLERIAEASGMKASKLIRIATEEFLAKVEKTGKIEIDVSLDGMRPGGEVGAAQPGSLASAAGPSRPGESKVAGAADFAQVRRAAEGLLNAAGARVQDAMQDKVKSPVTHDPGDENAATAGKPARELRKAGRLKTT